MKQVKISNLETVEKLASKGIRAIAREGDIFTFELEEDLVANIEKERETPVAQIKDAPKKEEPKKSFPKKDIKKKKKK